ncbi:MAG: hypothetical protein KIS73_19555 [Enhydrobacter sp.]|nr:hypothetical protein [Enhydrobacter sp.]
MGRPPKKERDRLPNDGIIGGAIMLDSIGVAGWTLAAEILIFLVERDIITDKQGRKIMRGAIQTIVDMDTISPNIAFKAARDVLVGQIEGWEKAAKAL